MRIVHTSDWHAGRVWKGLNRLDELEAVLAHLAGYVESESVDLLLVTGDVFDGGVPSAAAERLVFRFLKRVGEADVRTVLIAGNHDSGARVEAWGQLAELVGVHALGRPRAADDGGVLELKLGRGGERAIIAAVPFAAPRTLVTALELAKDDADAALGYADRMARLVEHLCERFSDDAVNVLCAHTHLDGAVVAQSERRVHVGDDWAARPERLPMDAHYVALGHIHRPQRIEAPSPAHYAGSVMQLDFGEQGEEKSFVVVDAVPGKPATIRCVPYEGAKELRTVRAPLDELRERVEELAEVGWLRVQVPILAPDPEINRQVRALLPNAVSVDVELPVEPDEEAGDVMSLADHTPGEVFEAYYERKHGIAPASPLRALFDELYAKLGGV